MSMLDGNEHGTLLNALQVAAERFDYDARLFQTIAAAKAGGGEDQYPFITAASAARLVDQFETQARDTRALARRFARSSEVALSEDEPDGEADKD
ncbi:MAG: hypothetical protein ABR549_06900 [Mycobacteriales bacterium]